jgi:hypothetical protein
MRLNSLKAIVKTALRGAAVLLLGAGVASAQQTINLSAGPNTIALPDGSVVPMWGYTCGAVVSGSTATCAALNPNAAGGWSPVVITIPTIAAGGLQINLTNNLTFGPNSVPTSLTIVGQLGGGLGTTATSTPSPDHTNAQSVTWPIPDPTTTGTPPLQGARVQSFSTEVTGGATTALTWASLRPGTYLIESGTHPSIQGTMGLYGILVVTTAPNAAVTPAAVGCAYGYAPASTALGTPTCAVPYDAEIPMLFGEIDPVQNNTVSAAVNTAGFSETMVWSGLQGGCGNPGSATYHQCYPPTVNYTPLYYTINGAPFNKTNAIGSLFPATSVTATAGTGKVLVRLVNAGSRMHVPSIVGSQTVQQQPATGGVTPAPTVNGFSLIAEDGNPLPGLPRVQSEVFMAAGKTYDVMINAPAAAAPALPIFDRELSLSANATGHDAGMLAYLNINGSLLSAAPLGAAVARADSYASVVTGQTLTVSDPSKGVIANDTNVYGVQLVGTVPGLTLNADGTFTYTGAPTSFTYCANGTVTGTTCSSGITATVTLGAATIEASSGITCAGSSFTSNVATYLSVQTPGVLAGCHDAAGYPLTVDTSSIVATGVSVIGAADGGFIANAPTTTSPSFTFKAKNSQGTLSGSVTVTLNFLAGSGLKVTVVDGKTMAPLSGQDYRWIIEEDRTFYIDPTKTTNTGTSIVPTFGTNFHTSYMPVVATGCTGELSCESGQTSLGNSVVCDVGNGICRPGTQQIAVDPSQVHLDPTKRYYISVLPGDAANSFEDVSGCLELSNPVCGHGMGGAPITVDPVTHIQASAVTVLVQSNPFPPSKLSVFVFEDDFPLNGENDAGGQVSDNQLGTEEPGLGGFNITLFDDAGGPGDATGQMTYDMFNMPLSNSLDGTIDPASGHNACPISKKAISPSSGLLTSGITGTIVTCPTYEDDGVTQSPLAGQVVVANLMPGRYGVVATPAADRIGRGEEWLQTNTLDGQKAHDSFLRVDEPSFFQEYGPASYHVAIGFANPKIINARKASICNGGDPNSGLSASNCTNTITGTVTTERMSRTPDERLYSSGDNSSFGFTQCYVSFGDPDGEDFAFTKCDASGKFSLSGLPDGDWRVTVFDQWNDMLVDGLSTPVRLAGGSTLNLGDLATNQWQSNIYTTTFFDKNGNGVRDADEEGLALVATNNRFRDGSYSNFNSTDLNGYAGFNEVFPLFSWYVIETDSTRYKNTGVHVVYDAGGPADGTPGGGGSSIAANLANTIETIPVPAALRVPGAFYCSTADCSDAPAPLSVAAGSGSGGSTGRVDPPSVWTEGWQGFSGQNNIIEFGKKPYTVGENGGIHGEVIYASTRPFDDPALLIHTSWTPDVPNVTINLYKEGTAPDGSTSLKLVDTTKTSSFDDWAQGFRSDGVPNMNCPGQGTASGTNADLFFFSIYNQPQWLDMYNNGGTPVHTIPNNSQFKCYDGMHNWNQVQPAPYDGLYIFPSVTGRNPVTGNTTGTNCTICGKDNDPTDAFRFGKEDMLPAGKYVVEMVVPPGYELVKEEDKNILIGDNYIAPVSQEFAGLGNIFILPDQAAVAAGYNANNPQMATTDQGRTTLPSTEADTGSVEQLWPCVGQARIVPDFISLFPQSGEVAPFAGATRNLCDRKEVTLVDQSAALAKFWVFTSAHAAAHFTGVITDDFTSEFDPFSPQFGEKFAPPDLPISIKDWTGAEIARTYADHWGAYNGLTYSTWEVNPPNPTGYAPTMMITCMNDPGTGASPDPLYNPQYSNFCYEIPFMPGQTQYMDTPVTPTSAFAGAGYNNPDCAYPDATPAVSEVDGDGVGPWVSASGTGHTLTITALGDTTVPNNAYSGPSATTAPFNAKTVTRHYGFGSTSGTVALVGTDGVVHPLTGVSWSDGQITGVVPALTAAASTCSIQQQAQYRPAGTTNAVCAQLVITAANGKSSIDTVTVTVGGKAPTHVAASASIQAAIDAAKPGDLLMIDPTCTATTGAVACTTVGAAKSNAVHSELLLMWKPVRLQGVGAASSIIDGNTHPAGKLDTWRARVNCLFGLTLDGVHTGWTAGCGSSAWPGWKPTANNPQVDRIPLEPIVGWDANYNGNLAQLLQEPSLMGALEGAAITVLSKGVNFPSNPFLADTFPTGTALLTNSTNTRTGCGANTATSVNPFPSNFWCNPSGIDGLGIRNSSQGGGGIFVHAWGHNLQIANNHIANNSGTLSGGINVGQGEFPEPYLGGATNVALNAAPGSCQTSNVTNLILPYCQNMNVNVNHNYIGQNSSTGDELFSATPAGAGGVSFCTGSDFYKFQYNWVCGNLSTGDGGGFGHLGFSYNGDIEHNSFLFNQSTNPTIPTNGGGLVIMGTPDADPTCNALADTDCTVLPGAVTPSDGIGPSLTINANLIMGNSADSGSGGGIALQNVNGTDVISFPTTPSRWNHVILTNNIITNNVAGWDGGGISLLDALNTDIVNNTIASNDTTASSGVLFNTLGAPLASTAGPCGIDPNTGLPKTNPCVSTSTPQPAGVVSIQNSAVLTANINLITPTPTITCPAGHFAGTTATNGTCKKTSYPLLDNDVIFENRVFYIGVGGLAGGTENQQNVVTLYNGFTSAVPGNQTATGSCPTGSSYWDIGVRGDTGPTNHASTVTLNPTYSFLTAITGTGYDVAAQHNNAANPSLVSQYCNGSRIPPEFGGTGFQVPPGISDATVPNPLFSLTPAATVDEGNNWINLSWGPLAVANPLTNATLGNYAQAAGSPVNNYIPSTATANYTAAPTTDFFGNPRKTNNAVDAGAVEYVATGAAAVSVTPTSLALPNTVVGNTSASSATYQVTLSNSGGVAFTGLTATFTGPFSRGTGDSCGATLAGGASCTIRVVFHPTATGAATGTLAITGSVTVTGSPVSLSGSGIAAVIAATLTPTSHNYGNQTRNCPGTTVAQRAACALDPAQVFTLTNTGNAPLTGIGHGTLGGTNAADFFVSPLLSTCGAAGGTQVVGNTTLAPGATCVVTVQFRPLTSEGTGAKNATISVTDLAGTQTSTLTGTAQ